MTRFSKSISLLVALFTVTMVMPIEGLAQQQRREAKKKDRPRQTPTQYLQKLSAKNAPANPFIAVTMHAIERYMENKPAESEIDQAVRKVLDKRGARANQTLRRAVTNWNAIPRTVRDNVTPPEFRDLRANQAVSNEKVQKFVKARYGRVPKHTFQIATPPDLTIAQVKFNSLQPAAQYPGGGVRIQGTSLSQGISVKFQSTVRDINAVMSTTFVNGTAIDFNVSQGYLPANTTSRC